MPNYKYNSVCDREIHTNNPRAFALHVASCPVCQKNLPPEVIEWIKPFMPPPKKTEEKTVEAVKGTEEKATETQEPQESQEPKEPKEPKEPQEPKEEEFANHPIIIKSEEGEGEPETIEPETHKEASDFDEKLKKSPAFIALVNSVKAVSQANREFAEKVNSDISELNSKVDALAEGFNRLPEIIGEAISKRSSIQENQVSTENMTESGSEVSEDASNTERDIPRFTKEEIAAAEAELERQKRELGMSSSRESPTETINPIIRSVRDTVREIRGVIDAWRGGGQAEQSSGERIEPTPKNMEELILKLLAKNLEYDPIKAFAEGAKFQAENFRDVTKLVTGKGLPGETNSDDTRRMIREAIREELRSIAEGRSSAEEESSGGEESL